MKKVIMSIFVIVVLIFSYFAFHSFSAPSEPIRVGILHSLTGTMAVDEKPLIDAELMAIAEINAAGGLLGRPIEPIIVDGRSDEELFTREAELLITQDKVAVVFGGWTSASRKAMKPIFEKYNSLLVYPLQYEGLEQSKNIIYMGASPNQQIIPAVKWAFDNLGKRFFLIGSDYIFPRVANEIIREQIKALGGQVIGESYIALGGTVSEDIISQIKELKPDVILNTINGSSNIGFFRKLNYSVSDLQKIPVLSFSLSEAQANSHMTGSYAAWNYFQSIDTDLNRDFIIKFKEKYGQDRVIFDPMVSAYSGVYLWARGVEKANSTNIDQLRAALKNINIRTPMGIISYDSFTNHVWKTPIIGRLRSDGQIDIIWNEDNPIKPNPYPVFKSKEDWQIFIDSFYTLWGNKWTAPDKEL